MAKPSYLSLIHFTIYSTFYMTDISVIGNLFLFVSL